MSEIWKPIELFEGLYEISDQGRVRSLISWGRYKPGRILKPSLRDTGYLHVTMYQCGYHIQEKIHRLVARAFIGPCETGREVNHIDHNRTNNIASNLEYVTRKDNLIHAARARRLPKTILTESQVVEIRNKYRKGNVIQADLAAQYKVTRSCIQSVLRRSSWNWMPI